MKHVSYDRYERYIYYYCISREFSECLGLSYIIINSHAKCMYYITSFFSYFSSLRLCFFLLYDISLTGLSEISRKCHVYCGSLLNKNA